MRLHDLELLDRQRSRSEQDLVRDADLPHVVQRRCPPQHVHLVGGKLQLRRDQRGARADAPRVFAGVVVPELGGQRQPLEGLRLRFLQILRPFEHTVLETRLLFAERLFEEPDVEDVADPQKHLLHVQRLREEVLRARHEGPMLDLARDVRGEDEDGWVRRRVEGGLQLLHHGEPVHPRHVEVQDDEIGSESFDETAHLLRLRRGDGVDVPGLGEDPLQEEHVRLLVVDDEDPSLEVRFLGGHQPTLSAPGPASGPASRSAASICHVPHYRRRGLAPNGGC